MKTLTPQIPLEVAQFEALTEESNKRKIPVEELLRELIRQFLVGLPSFKQPRFEDHTGIINLGASGESEISTRHDHYLGQSLIHEDLH